MHPECWYSVTITLGTYCRSKDQLLAYAKSKDSANLPAWRAFNRAVGSDGSVGIWHETYVVEPGSYESIYNNMPPFGLGKAGRLEPIGRRSESAMQRFRSNHPPQSDTELP